MISDPVALGQTSLKQSLAGLLDNVTQDARELGCAHWLNPLKLMVAENASDSSWLREQQRQHGNLNDVVREASERLMRQDNQSPEKMR